MKKAGLLIGAMAVLFLCGTAHADRTVWYVHPDSTLNTIQAGLDSCADNDIVLVGPGSYRENITWPNTQGIHLISELGRDTTIIDGESAGIVIRIETGVDSTTVINDFTIRNGYSSYDAGGILCYNNSSPTISDNVITQNTAQYGGGIECTNSSPIIINNIITNNMATSYGGGIECYDNNTSPTISNNVITQNTAQSGGGILCYNNSSPTITNNTIAGNTVAVGGGGIGVSYNATPTISDNEITDNIAQSGGGIGFRQCSPTIRHNIITNNTAPYGGGIYCDSSSSGFIDSCTISNNSGDGIYCRDSSEPEIHYCNITNNGGYAIRNTDPSVTVNADSNWWGDATGPYHPTANPGGMGDTVSDYVDFDPWTTEPFPWGIEEHEPSQSITTFLQISPNPFRDRVNITFSIGQRAESIELKIYDVSGRLVKSFRITPYALRNTLSWDGRDDRNRALPSGVYFLKFKAGDYSATEKLLLIR